MKRIATASVASILTAAFLFAVLRAGIERSPDLGTGETRIVSLAPNITEMIFELGLENRLVGVSEICDYPPRAQEIEAVGGYGAPSIERLLALRPDIVITSGIERKELPELLAKSRVAFLDLRIGDFEAMFAAFHKIAEVAGSPDAAAHTVAQLRAELDQVAARFADIPREARPTVFAEIWHSPVMTAGAPAFLSDVIHHAGGVNAAESIGKEYATINAEHVVEWNPDFLLLCYMNEGEAAASQVGSRIGWSRLAAVQNGNIIGDIHPDLLLRPGPRLVQGVQLLADRLWPQDTESAERAREDQ